MSERFPSHGTEFVLDSVGHMGTGVTVQQDDAVSDFTQMFILIFVHMQYHRQQSSAYEFHQVDILLLQGTKSPPSGPVWTNSPLGTLSLS
jgi:hypothetical protein